MSSAGGKPKLKNILAQYLPGMLFLVLLNLPIQLMANGQEPGWPKPPYSVEQLRASHKNMESIWPWLGQPEYKLHLRNEENYELLLAIRGYSRGGTYVLFAERNGKWALISDEIEQAHHPVYVLKPGHNGWHDFETFVPAWGSGGAEVWVFTYTWDGMKYKLKNQKDGKWCDQEPFRSDTDLCPDR